MANFSTRITPTMPLLGLSGDEKNLIATLSRQGIRDRDDMALCEAFYQGLYVVQNLRIAVPQELEFLELVLGWPALAVDPYVERLEVDSFRRRGATDGDEYLIDAMEANGFAGSLSMAVTDALSMRRGYWMVGSPSEPGGVPVVTVESPLNMSVLWDLRGTTPRAAMQEYVSEDGRRRGTLLLPNQTVHLAVNDAGEWEVADRDEHDFDFVPIVRMANRPRTNNRDGRSEITPAIQSLTTAASRRLLGLEVASELYSVPQKVVLGAAEDAFVKSDGTAASAWDTYVTKVLGLERDADGELPQIHQFKTYDPSTFTKLLDWYASAMAGMVAATPQDLGLYTQGNPASAEAGAVQEDRRDRRAKRMQRDFSPELAKVAQMLVRFDNKGSLPKEYERLYVDWMPVTMPTPGVTSDAVTKEIAAGAVPATSDVILRRLGYSAIDRIRLAQDRAADDNRQLKQAVTQAFLPRQGASGGETPTA